MYYLYIQILEIFIHTMTVLILVSGFRGFKVGFNSLCAFASVNHLHLHAYYLEHDLFVDTCVSGLTMSLLPWVFQSRIWSSTSDNLSKVISYFVLTREEYMCTVSGLT